jgi:hypothetical protein
MYAKCAYFFTQIRIAFGVPRAFREPLYFKSLALVCAQRTVVYHTVKKQKSGTSAVRKELWAVCRAKPGTSYRWRQARHEEEIFENSQRILSCFL